MIASAHPRRHRHDDRQRPQLRARAEVLLDRAQHLPQVERLLLEQRLHHGLALVDLALLHRTSVSHLRRQLRQICSKLQNPCFVLANRFAEQIPADLRALARSHLLEGLTLRRCAARHHLSLHQVRQNLALVRTLLVLAAGAPQQPADSDEFDEQIDRSRRAWGIA